MASLQHVSNPLLETHLKLLFLHVYVVSLGCRGTYHAPSWWWLKEFRDKPIWSPAENHRNITTSTMQNLSLLQLLRSCVFVISLKTNPLVYSLKTSLTLKSLKLKVGTLFFPSKNSYSSSEKNTAESPGVSLTGNMFWVVECKSYTLF